MEENVKEKKKMISVSKAIIIAGILIIFALAYSYKGLFIAATVNGVPISRLSVISELEKASGKTALENILTLKIINDEAKKRGIAIGADEINSEIAKIEEQLKPQNRTLDDALGEQNMTREKLEEQIVIQKELEKMLEDKLSVTDDEVNKYIADNQISIPEEGQEDDYQNQIKEHLRQEKFGAEINTFIQTLKAQANIRYFVNY